MKLITNSELITIDYEDAKLTFSNSVTLKLLEVARLKF